MAVSIVLERPFTSNADHARQLDRQRVYILPTRQGYILALVLVTMLVGAINYNNNMAYILTFLLGSVFMVCIVHTCRNLTGLVITNAAPAPVFAGDTALFPLSIDNRDGPDRPALEVLCSPGNPIRRKHDKQKHHPVSFSVAAGDWQSVSIPVTYTQRGILPLGRVIISTSFPLGLFRAWSYLHADSECLIYPKPEGIDQMPVSLSPLESGNSGDNSGVNDFAGFRQYNPGDSIRNIAWKAVAREHPLLVKRFSGDGGLTCLLTWDQVQHLPDSESRLSQLCLWLVQAEQQDWLYGLEIPGHNIALNRGTSHLHLCLEALARH